MVTATGVVGVNGGVVRRWWYLTIRLGGSWTGSRFSGVALGAAATSGFGAILISSKGRALRGGGG
jgi:hypothetical protein